jgi:hypothetical protein
MQDVRRLNEAEQLEPAGSSKAAGGRLRPRSKLRQADVSGHAEGLLASGVAPTARRVQSRRACAGGLKERDIENIQISPKKPSFLSPLCIIPACAFVRSRACGVGKSSFMFPAAPDFFSPMLMAVVSPTGAARQEEQSGSSGRVPAVTWQPSRAWLARIRGWRTGVDRANQVCAWH